MADKTPVRVVFDSSNVATGLAEFQSGESVGTAFGGTGLTSIGSAGQVLKVNAAGNGLVFGAEGDISITNLVAPTNADLTMTTSGTGGIILNDITISDNGISTNRSNDDFKINASGTGTVVLENLKIGTSGATVTTILDEDGFDSDSATSLATQQSIKAYVDTQITAEDLDFQADSGGALSIDLDSETITFTGGTGIDTSGSGNTVTFAIDSTVSTLAGSQALTNKTIDVDNNTVSNIEVDNLKSGVLDTDITSVSGSDDTLASAKAIKTYVDSQVTAQDLDFATDDSTALSIDLDSEVLQVSGGANIATSGSANTITIALDTALTGLSSVTSTAIVTNNISSSDSTAVRIDDALNVDGALDVGAGFTISNGTSITAILDEDAMGSNSATSLATQQSVKAYVDTQDANIASDTLTFTNKTIDANGTGNNISNLDIGNMTAASVVLESEGISSNDNDTTLPTSAAVKDYADTKAVLSGSTNNNVATVTGAHALVGEGNLTFDGSTLAVTGAATISTTLAVTGASTLDGVAITDNTISTNASNSNLELSGNGSGKVSVSGFLFPTTDGDAGDFLKTDGAGTLSFASSETTASDDTRVIVKNNKSMGSSARTMDYFQTGSADMAWYFVALNDLTNDHSSASCFAVAHNDSAAFVSGARGGVSGTANTLPTTTADISSGQVRVKITAPSADSKVSFYKIPISTANTSDATAGVTVTTSNTDVDSASESIDSFAHASFRAAKYTILIDDDAKTETGVTEALVVHDGTNAYVAQYGTINTGNNDMITLSAAIDGSNVVLSAAGLAINLKLKIHKILLSDSMTAVSNANQKIIGATTVSSSATAFDNFDLDDATAAVYYVVGKNATEDTFSVNEVFCAGAPGEASVTQGPFVSTKASTQLDFTAAFKSDADNSLELSVASTSGGSTTVNAYRINCLAE